jgi:hypothetical protein
MNSGIEDEVEEKAQSNRRNIVKCRLGTSQDIGELLIVYFFLKFDTV